MKTYSVRFYNDITKSVFEAWEFQRTRFTKRDWDNIVLALFATAAKSIENRSLFADVYETEADEMPPIGTLGVITVACETTVNRSEIWAHIFANSTHVRSMCIAC